MMGRKGSKGDGRGQRERRGGEWWGRKEGGKGVEGMRREREGGRGQEMKEWMDWRRQDGNEGAGTHRGPEERRMAN